ncbi:MAG TPA: signal peptidase I [Clostridiales bacterium]|nr:signal peptidase I [Clostridiales bacterium]
MEEKKNTPDLKKVLRSAAYLVITLFLIMSFVISAYRIPTGSMERTLRIGDMLLVNKFYYGFRSPDWFGIPFTEFGFDIPWFKTPLFNSVKQGDVVVFKHFDEQMNQWLYYVKRCVALPGQTVEIVNKDLYVDGKLFSEFYDTVEVDEANIDLKAKARFEDPLRTFPQNDENFKNSLIKDLIAAELYNPKDSVLFLDPEKLNKVIRYGKMFNYFEQKYSLCLPNARVASNSNNAIFKDKFVEVTGDNILDNLNFRDNFRKFTVPEGSYFMMGDNRDNSYDSRYWGFVNNDLIVGKPIMVYFSFDYNDQFNIYEFWKNDFEVRWERIGYYIQ